VQKSVKFHAADIDNMNPTRGEGWGERGGGVGWQGGEDRPRGGGAIRDGSAEKIQLSTTSVNRLAVPALPRGFCNINIYDSFTKLI